LQQNKEPSIKIYIQKKSNTEANYIDSSNLFIDNNPMPMLNKEEKQKCEEPVTKAEILKSLKNLSSGKTPGTDWLKADFYNYFWLDIQDPLTDSIQYALSHGELSVEQKRGIITLLPKKTKTEFLLRTGDQSAF
jgi:hypothetical protein